MGTGEVHTDADARLRAAALMSPQTVAVFFVVTACAAGFPMKFGRTPLERPHLTRYYVVM